MFCYTHSKECVKNYVSLAEQRGSGLQTQQDRCDSYTILQTMTVKCYGSTAVSKTVSWGSTPYTVAI